MIKNYYQKQIFLPNILSIIFNPVYIQRRLLKEKIKKYASMITGDVLDFGCGSKPYKSLFTHANSYSGSDILVSGHDHNDSEIDIIYDGSTLPLEGGSFDSAVSFEVFEHVFDIKHELSEIRRVLKPGGTLLITLPFVWEEHEIPYDFARYTSFGIRHVLESGGFEILSAEKTGGYILALNQTLIIYLLKNVLPKNKYLALIGQLVFIFPLSLLSLIADFILPKSYSFYLNNVVLARKVT